MRVFSLCLLTLLLRYAVAEVKELHWTYYVKQGTEECVQLHANLGEQIETRAEVLTPGLRDIRLIISGPTGTLYDKVVYNREFEKIGKIIVPVAGSGEHRICTSNSMSRFTSKKLTFYLTVKDVEQSTLENAKLEHLGPIVDSIIKVSDGLDNIGEMQHQIRIDEQMLRNQQDTVNSRVQWLSIARGVGLLALSLIQLHFIRSWFNHPDKRYQRV